jgi:hypothetical protein
MKVQIFKVIFATLASVSLAFSYNSVANAQQVRIGKNLQPDPTNLTGTSGGPNKSNCGNITTTPSQVLQITENMPYLRLTVESTGKPTLLIDGPGGRFCVLADNYSGGKPEISGFWQAGTYSLYIGELSQAQYNYTLSISQQKK